MFLVLNSTLKERAISADQLSFVEQEIKRNDELKRIFIFFHEVLWNSDEKYSEVLTNNRSRYYQIKEYSNYWQGLHPLLVETQKDIYIITGDVAGREDAIPAFYDKVDNVTLIASGMGEVREENYLKVKVYADSVQFKLIPLNSEVELKPLSYYSIPAKPDSIFGDSLIYNLNSSYNYYCSPIFNATNYEWILPEKSTGNSSLNSIDLVFENDFMEGEIGVKAVHDGFGRSEMKTIKVNYQKPNAINLQIKHSMFCFQCNNEILIKNAEFHILKLVEFYNTNGKLIYGQKLGKLNSPVYSINANEIPKGFYIVVFHTTNAEIRSKIHLH